jgi:hypothetical protein
VPQRTFLLQHSGLWRLLHSQVCNLVHSLP